VGVNKKLFSSWKHFSPRGFIGPIGDDLPSIIPIVVALLLFFTIFSVTLNSFNQKNDLQRRQIEMISIARELKGNSLIESLDQFTENCNSSKLEKRAYSFLAVIFQSNYEGAETISDLQQFVDGGNANEYMLGEDAADGTGKKYFSCMYTRVGGMNFSGKEKNYFIRFYPVAVQTLWRGDYLIVPAIMVVVVW